MAKKPKKKNVAIVRRPERVVLTREEVLKRMKDFPKRKEQFIASLREGKDRGVRS